jgi:hypothetical protein
MKSKVTAVMTRSYYVVKEFEGNTSEEIFDKAQEYFDEFDFTEDQVSDEEVNIIDVEVIK